MAKANKAAEAKPKKKPTGRPSGYSDKIATAICERLITGESLRSICRDAGMPKKSTVFQWLAARPAFADQYARARELQADTYFDEVIDIADDGSNDWIEREIGKGLVITVENGEALKRSQMRIDARKWMAGKLRPKKYGERVALEHSGPEGGPMRVTNMTDEELERIARGSGKGTAA